MLLLVPYLFPAAHLRETAAQDLRLPALQTLLARGAREDCPADGVEAALCDAFGIARQQDWPLAPIACRAEGGDAASGYWLRADPVHLRVMRDRIVLTDPAWLELDAAEANALAASIGEHFGAALAPLPRHPLRWYLRYATAPRLRTTPLSMACGRAIDGLLPQGDDAGAVRAQLNELQMLLHEHPVNQQREARGAPVVNALWLWGGGTLPAAPASRRMLYAHNADACALGAFSGAPVQPLPACLDERLLAPASLILLDALTPAGQSGDAYGWREALRALESAWFAPLRQALRRLPRAGVRLVDPVHGQMLTLRRTDAWKIWRRPRGLCAQLSRAHN